MLALMAASAAAVLSCRIEDAHYALRTKPAVSARFKVVNTGRDWPSGLALAVHFSDTGHTYWWLPWSGGTDGRQNIASTEDVEAPGWHPPSPEGGPRPLGDMDYLATDAAYNVIDSLPRAGSAAPAHILLTRLGDAVWHNGPWENRDSAPRQFFDLVACPGGRPAD